MTNLGCAVYSRMKLGVQCTQQCCGMAGRPERRKESEDSFASERPTLSWNVQQTSGSICSRVLQLGQRYSLRNKIARVVPGQVEMAERWQTVELIHFGRMIID